MEEMRPKDGGRRIILSVFVGVSILGTGVYFFNRSNGPEDSINQIQVALTDRNKIQFDKYVNSDAVIGGLIKATIESSYSDEENSLSLSSSTRKQLNELESQLQPLLLLRWKEQLDRYFVSGELGGDSLAGGLAAFWNKEDVTKVTEVKEISREGNVSTVSIRLYKPIADTSLVLTVRLNNEGGNWRLFDATSLMTQKQWLKQLSEGRP